MTKPDPHRLARGTYPVGLEITTRVSDIDGNGHLNAIRLGKFYEEARASFYRLLNPGQRHPRVLVAELKIRYLGEGFWPGTVEVRTGIVRLGSSAFTMGQGLWQGEVCIGLCDTVLVHGSKGKSSPLPADFRDQLEHYGLAISPELS
jgi:acyl-CoA thioester hydrolase